MASNNQTSARETKFLPGGQADSGSANCGGIPLGVMSAQALRGVLDDLHHCYTGPLQREQVMVGGTALWKPLEAERRRLRKEISTAAASGKVDQRSAMKYRIYTEELCEMTRMACDAEVSARIRQKFAGCIEDKEGTRLVTDTEESLEVLSQSEDGVEEAEEEDCEVGASTPTAPASTQIPPDSQPPAPAPPKAAGSKKKDDYRKKKDDEMRMFASCQVRDEHGNLVPTLGPFLVPLLADRSIKPDTEVRSRRSLKKKALQESSDEEGRELATLDESAAATQGSSLDATTGNNEWMTAFKRVPADTLRKVLETLKVRTHANDDLTTTVAKAVFRLGLDKCIHAMEKQRMFETMLQKKWTRPQLIEQLEEDFVGTIESSPELRKNAAIALSITTSTAQDLYERIIVQGLQTALRVIRPRLLKKVYADILSAFGESEQTEPDLSVDKQVEFIVWKIIPRERVRLQLEKVSLKHKTRGIGYIMESSGCTVIYNTGKILFRLMHVSSLRKNTQRHYSPEFEYGGNRWSMLTMQSKDQLALYLCQTGSVHCKFILTLINSEESDSIRNEGSQRFHRTSAENDWGFNNIVSLDKLLDPVAGFWDQVHDSIHVDIALMIISDETHPAPEPVASMSQPNTTTAASQFLKEVGKKEFSTESPATAPAAVHQQLPPDSRLLKQLVEEEKVRKEEEWRKKNAKIFKADRAKLQRQEEKERKNIETAESVSLEGLMVPIHEEFTRLRQRVKKKPAGGGSEVGGVHANGPHHQHMIDGGDAGLETLQAQNNRLREETNDTARGIVELQSQRQTLSAELQKLKVADSQARANLKQAKVRLAAQRKTLEDHKAEVDKLEERKRPSVPLPATMAPTTRVPAIPPEPVTPSGAFSPAIGMNRAPPFVAPFPATSASMLGHTEWSHPLFRGSEDWNISGTWANMSGQSQPAATADSSLFSFLSGLK